MAYTNPLFASKQLRPVDIFTPHWRLLSLAGACYSYFKYLPIWWIPLILFKLLWKSRGIRTFITINQKISPKLSWLLYLFAVPLDDFETDFRQAWIEKLDSSRTGEDEVLMVNIFVGKESIPVPVLFNRIDVTKNRDAKTFMQLRMWYFWMQYKRGLAELVLPRQLMYIERIKICPSSKGHPVRGDTIESFDLGRYSSSKVINFLNPDGLDHTQCHQTVRMLKDINVGSGGLDFIRAWDRNNAAVIALIPFVFSLLFAIVWIVVSVAAYAIDVQVAVQTAFTVAAFIVTAGALLIALFAFLEDKTGQA